MSDFLLNLAVRGAVGPQFPVTALPAPVPSGPALALPHEVGLEEVAQEESVQPTSPVMFAPRQEIRVPLPPDLPEARTPAPTEASAQEVTRAPLHPAPPLTREIRTEHREVVHDASSERPAVEIRETVHETEIVREKVIEREIVADTPRPREIATTAAQPRISSSSPRPAEPRTSEVLREIVLEATAPQADEPLARPGVSLPAILPGTTAGIATTERAGTPQVDATTVSPRPIYAPEPSIVRPVKTASRPEPKEPSTSGPELRHTPEASAQTSMQTPLLRPAPPAVPALPNAAASKAAKPEQSVEVRIGSLEIRSAPAAPQVQVRESAPVSREPVEGFEQYASLRRYNSWFRE